jgi:hypothetical protein
MIRRIERVYSDDVFMSQLRLFFLEIFSTTGLVAEKGAHGLLGCILILLLLLFLLLLAWLYIC